MEKIKEDSVIKKVVEIGSEITGGVAGSILGGLLAGVPGMVLGGGSGPVIVNFFKVAGTEIVNKFTNTRSGIRSSAVYTYALAKMLKNQESHLPQREQSFFTADKQGRSAAEELLEGIIINAQKEYEERKLPFLGNLYANIIVHPEISREYANQFIRIINQISFRQLCLMELIKNKIYEQQGINSKIRGLNEREIKQTDIVAELYDLEQKGLIHLNIPLTYDGTTGRKAVLAQDKIQATALGKSFAELLSLQEIDRDLLDHLNEEIKIILK
jgi:hypothetical protein